MLCIPIFEGPIIAYTQKYYDHITNFHGTPFTFSNTPSLHTVCIKKATFCIYEYHFYYTLLHYKQPYSYSDCTTDVISHTCNAVMCTKLCPAFTAYIYYYQCYYCYVYFFFALQVTPDTIFKMKNLLNLYITSHASPYFITGIIPTHVCACWF